ncbi:hypothetical protein ACGFRB_18005 [Streptomyces sp. NPDC048718]|uniref:hypothetical protein n=1 Tax=Streptomyces sp. NPDC048718 TaxID=3365587 RepID=UPI0037197E24
MVVKASISSRGPAPELARTDAESTPWSTKEPTAPRTRRGELDGQNVAFSRANT